MIIQEDSLDDLLNIVFTQVIENGERVTSSSKGSNRELRNVKLVLNNPRTRISLSETRSTLISCIGEFLWYLSGNSDIKFIEYYISNYRDFIDFKANECIPVPGAYGPRIFGRNNQFEITKNLLLQKKETRRAIIAIYSIDDNLRSDSRDIPCTCYIQFFIRNHKLEMTVNMRSNDVYSGLTHDIFSFTMIQELMWANLKGAYPDLKLGSYTHFVGSLHLYDDKLDLVKHYLEKEGWQSKSFMHPISPDFLNSDINEILSLEESLRVDNICDLKTLDNVKDIFWKEVAIVLIIHFHIKNKEYEKLDYLINYCTSKSVRNFINKKINLLEAQINREGI